MNKLELLKKVLAKKPTRVTYLEHDFYNFFLYYFRNHIKYPKMAQFQKDWCDSAGNGLNLYVEGSRECGKSTILGMALEIWKICYKKAGFICNVCYDKKKAKAFNKMIVKELLQNKYILEDFGVLFSMKMKDYNDDDISEKGIDEFVTTNSIKVRAFGMGEAIRGELFNSKEDGNVRPDHITLDDIDNNKNTKNPRIIKEDMNHLNVEIFGGIDKVKGQIVCLGNVIRKDGRNPRLKNQFKENNKWKIFSNFIYGKAGVTNGEIQWDRYVETEKEAEEFNKNNEIKVISLENLKNSAKGFEQNYLGIPLIKGQTVIKEEWIIYNTELNDFDYIQIGLDPAFSTKTGSDAFGIVVTGFKKIKDTTYKKVLFCKKLEGEQKDTLIAINIIKSLYHKHKAKRLIVEGNNGGEQFGNLLKREGVAVDIVSATKDKLTRLKEFEGDLMRGLIYFSPDVSDLVDELLEFTGEDGGEDNLVDAFVHSLKEKRLDFYTG